MVNAALNRVNPLTAEKAATKPINCHEAVLGWLLTSMGYPRRWRLIKEAAKRDGVGHPLQFQGDWMWNNIYTIRLRVSRATVVIANPGDILCSGVPGRPTHSMVVVSRRHDAITNQTAVNIRGFNNVGTFIKSRPQPAYMRYDPYDRNVADPSVWNLTSRKPNAFAGDASLYRIKYQDAMKAAARAFPWEKSTVPTRSGERWHYNPIQGWRWY